jgi:hypothetical protein
MMQVGPVDILNTILLSDLGWRPGASKEAQVVVFLQVVRWISLCKNGKSIKQQSNAKVV